VPPPLQKETLTIPGYAQNGIRFEATSTSNHRITILEGAYNTWPPGSGSENQWRTIIHIYKNSDIHWGKTSYGFIQPIEQDFAIGRFESSANTTQEDAEVSVKGQSIEIYLQAGDFLIFVPIDEKDSYAENRGEIILEVSFHAGM
jgi:hypothetical protein